MMLTKREFLKSCIAAAAGLIGLPITVKAKPTIKTANIIKMYDRLSENPLGHMLLNLTFDGLLTYHERYALVRIYDDDGNVYSARSFEDVKIGEVFVVVEPDGQALRRDKDWDDVPQFRCVDRIDESLVYVDVPLFVHRFNWVGYPQKFIATRECHRPIIKEYRICGPASMPCDVKLEAVGIDEDGTIHSIDNLIYKPSGDAQFQPLSSKMIYYSKV